MRFPFLTSLRDLAREHRDRKITHLLLAFSLLIAGILASLRLDVASPEETVEGVAGTIVYVGKFYDVGSMIRNPLAPSVEAGKVVQGKTGAERWMFRLRFRDPKAFRIGIQNWKESLQGKEPSRIVRSRREIGSLPDPSTEERERYLVERLESLGFTAVSARQVDEAVYEVSISPKDRHSALHVKSVRILGSWTFAVREIFSCTEILVTVQKWIVDNVAGLFGICLCVILTGTSFFRSFEKGVVEIALAKPVPRPALFLARVGAAIALFFLHAAFLIGVSSAAIWWRTGFWNGGFLWGIPLAALLFGILFPVSALVAVVGRSAALAPVAGLGVWMISTQLDSVYRVGLATLSGEIPVFWERTARVLYWIFPKTAEIKEWGLARLAVDGMSPEVLARLELVPQPGIPAGTALWSSLLFAGALLGMATWLFSRKEP